MMMLELKWIENIMKLVTNNINLTYSTFENNNIIDPKNLIWMFIILNILFILSTDFFKNYQIYIIPSIFLKLNDNPREYARRKRLTTKQIQEIENQVKWKSPVDYPPKFKKDYFRLDVQNTPMDRREIAARLEEWITRDADHDIIQKKLKFLKLEGFAPYTKKQLKYKTVFTRPMEHSYILPDDDRAPIHNKTEDYLNWDADWDKISYFWDHFVFSVPILFVFLFIHWIIAETLLLKFKCQQHYQLNQWIFGIGPVVIYYIYCHLKYIQYDTEVIQIKGGGNIIIPYIQWFRFFMPEWPIYMILYDWWLYLSAYSVIVIFFFFFGPKTIYLRNNDILDKTKYILNFIFVFIGLLLPPLFAQKEFPFWQNVEKVLILNPERIQFHYGITYLTIIILIIAMLSVLWFYFLIIIANVFKAYIYSDNSYYDDIEWLLFSGQSDDSDWSRAEGVPNSLKNPFFIRNLLNLRTTGEGDFRPDGFQYKKFKIGKNIKETYQWTGSYSKWYLLSWYFSISFYCYSIKWLYTYYTGWSGILFFAIMCLLVLNLFYIIFIVKVLKKDIMIRDKKRSSILRPRVQLSFVELDLFYVTLYIKVFNNFAVMKKRFKIGVAAYIIALFFIIIWFWADLWYIIH